MADYFSHVLITNRDFWTDFRWIPSRLFVQSARAVSILILTSGLSGGAALADTPVSHEAMHPIVRGRNLQPRDDQLKALGYSDLTSRDTREVDRLYQQLMRKSAVGRAAG